MATVIFPTSQGIDLAGRVTPALIQELKDRGWTGGVLRYLGRSTPTEAARQSLPPDELKRLEAAGLTAGWKHLTESEVRLLSKAQIPIGSIYQRGTGDVFEGEKAAREYALDALARAKFFGQPEGSAIYFTCDSDINAYAQARKISLRDACNVVSEFLKVVHSVFAGRYKVGLYAQYDVIETLRHHKHIECFFQTRSWSKRKISTAANIYQHSHDVKLAGSTVDLCDFYGDEGFWLPPVGGNQSTPQGGNPAMEEKIKQLEQQVASLKEQVSRLQAQLSPKEPPSWAEEALSWAKEEAQVLHDEKGDETFHRLITVLHRLHEKGYISPRFY